MKLRIIIFPICFAVLWASSTLYVSMVNPEYEETYGKGTIMGETLLPALLITGIPYLVITKAYPYIKKRTNTRK